MPTRRPDRQPTTDLTRCQHAYRVIGATRRRPAGRGRRQPGNRLAAAADHRPASTVTLAHRTVIRTATLDWGRQWPPPPAPNVHPPPGPVNDAPRLLLRPGGFPDGKHWTVVARVRNRTAGTRDALNFTPVRARYVGLRITAATHHTPPMLEELTCPAASAPTGGQAASLRPGVIALGVSNRGDARGGVRLRWAGPRPASEGASGREARVLRVADAAAPGGPA